VFKPRIDQYLALIVLFLIFLLPVKQVLPQEKILPEIKLSQISPIPILDIDQQPDSFVATLSAQSIIAIDTNSASILLEKNSNQKVAPASTTKMLTALVARDFFSLDQVLVIKEKPLNIGHTIGFVMGEEFLFEDILKALLVNSGNDAAEVLAQNYPQSYEEFVVAMNNKASELHLQNSSFTNPSGLDAAAHYSTVADLSLIARELMKDEELKELVKMQQVQISDISGNHQYYLYNTNLLLGVEPGVVGIKTGTTDLAGEVLITQVEREDRKILIVVLGSQDRYSDTKQIINWIFSYYQWQEI